jgi:hypothetical protein
MKVGMLIKTDGGSWALTEKEALELLSLAKNSFMDEWKELRKKDKGLSGKQHEMLETLNEINSSFYDDD